MNKGILIVLVPILILLGYNTYEIHFKSVPEQTVYVNVNAVFDAFYLKQEMEKELQDETKKSSNYLDSLAFEIQTLSELEDKEQEVERLKSLYYQKRTYYENQAVTLTQKYDEQILTQMKQYIKDYGKSEGYKYILGKSADGFLLYGEDVLDVTDEVISYINGRYQGE